MPWGLLQEQRRAMMMPQRTRYAEQLTLTRKESYLLLEHHLPVSRDFACEAERSCMQTTLAF